VLIYFLGYLIGTSVHVTKVVSLIVLAKIVYLIIVTITGFGAF
jgi:hypothetical protein